MVIQFINFVRKVCILCVLCVLVDVKGVCSPTQKARCSVRVGPRTVYINDERAG